jgi:hypothetical protein
MSGAVRASVAFRHARNPQADFQVGWDAPQDGNGKPTLHHKALMTKPKATVITVKKNTRSATIISGRITLSAATVHKVVEHISTYGIEW